LVEIYRKKTYLLKTREDEDIPNAEDVLLFDVESYPKYDNVNPGTVTIEGWGLECWECQEKLKPHSISIISNRAELPKLTTKQLVRRLFELSPRSEYRWSQERDDEALEEFALIKK
jgi:hypothetical protein